MKPRLHRVHRAWRAALCIACGVLPSLSHAQDPTLDKVSLQLRWLHQFQFAGYYMAKEKGFYRDAGLEVEIRESRPGLDTVEEVVGGRADFGVGLSSLLVLRHQGKPVVLLANIFQHSAMALAMRQDRPGDSIHSLAGKRVMLERAADDIDAYLFKAGIKPGSYTRLEHRFQVEDLLNGYADAMTVYITDEVFTLDQAGFRYLLFSPRAMDVDFYGDNLFTSEAQIRKHPARARAFRDASLKGWEYALEHRDETLRVIREKYGYSHSNELLSFEAEQTDALIMPSVVPIGFVNPDRWKTIAEAYVNLGVLPDTRALEGFLYAPPTRRLPRWVNVSLATQSALILLSLFIIVYIHRSKRTIARSEEKYRQLVEKAPIGIFVSTASGKPISSNPALLRMMKADAMPAIKGPNDEILKTAYMRPEDRDTIVQRLRREGHIEGHEVICRRTDGEAIHVDLSARIARGDPQGDFVMEGFAVDVTERKRAEMRLSDNELRLRKIIDGVPISIILFSLNRDQKLLYINEQARKTFGYTLDEVPDLDAFRLKIFPDPDYRNTIHQKWTAAIHQALQQDGMIPSLEMKYTTRGGENLQMLCSAVILGDSTVLATLVDITPLREAETKLDQAQRDLERAAYELTENIPMGTYALIMRPGEDRGRFSFMSKRFVAMTGFDFDLLRQHPEREIEAIHPDDREMWKGATAEAFRKKTPFMGQARMIVKGQIRWFLAEANPRPLPDGSTLWEGVMTDITDQKRAEAVLRESEQRARNQEREHRLTLERKLKSSLMASAVAHEINQPLAAILMTVQMAQHYRSDPLTALDAVARETQRVVSTIEKMKVLLRNVETKHTTVDLHEVIDSSLLQVNEMALDHDVTLHRDIPEEPCRIPGDGAQLQMAITNLLRNAIDASAHPPMPRKREVVIQLAIHPDEVELSVGDSGPGWTGDGPDPHGLKTTKPGGTGIGLVIVRTALQNHHGRIIFGTSPMGGALVTLHLPRRPPQRNNPSSTHS